MKGSDNTMKKEEKVNASPPKHHATTPEGRENELIGLAYDAAEERIRNGTASSAEIVQLLRLGSSKARLEKEKLKSDMELQRAKIEALEYSKNLEVLFSNAIRAMQSYSGRSEEEYDEDLSGDD